MLDRLGSGQVRWVLGVIILGCLLLTAGVLPRQAALADAVASQLSFQEGRLRERLTVPGPGLRGLADETLALLEEARLSGADSPQVEGLVRRLLDAPEPDPPAGASRSRATAVVDVLLSATISAKAMLRETSARQTVLGQGLLALGVGLLLPAVASIPRPTRAPTGGPARRATRSRRRRRAAPSQFSPRPPLDLAGEVLESVGEFALSVAPSGEIRQAAAAVTTVLGHEPGDLVGRSLLELVPPAQQSTLSAQLVRCVGSRDDPRTVEIRLAHADGSWRHFEISLFNRLDDVRFGTLVLYCRDTTDLFRAELALWESEARYALLAQNTHDGLFDWDLSRSIIYFSPRWKAMLGYGDEELGDDPDEWLELLHEEDAPAVRQVIEQHIADRSHPLQCEYRAAHRDGYYRWMFCRGIGIRDEQGRAIRLIGTQTDITEQKSTEFSLQHAATHDALTDLPNRTMFAECVRRAASRAVPGASTGFAVLYLDLDRFKNINDSLGHATGDRLLVASARRILRCVRGGDVVARLGGDEFGVLLLDLPDLEEAQAIANRIKTEMTAPFDLDGHEIYISCSIGIASNYVSSNRPDDLLRDADTAMYEAKARGKSQYALFDADMHARVSRKLQLENDLHRAIERGGLELAYQPVVELLGRRIVGFEALIRWRHPGYGLLRPDEFIPLAEECGVIRQLDRWVIRTACEQLASWRKEFPDARPVVSINLSPAQLLHPEIFHTIHDELRRHNLSGSQLGIEIVETAVLGQPDEVADLLEQLRRLGVQLSMDDFGTGYSSLSNLLRFSFDVLKIDRSFLTHGDAAPERWKVVETIISLAQHLNVKIVAEGVESPEQAHRLLRLGCEYAQGFLFGAPMPPDEALSLTRGVPRPLPALPLLHLEEMDG